MGMLLTHHDGYWAGSEANEPEAKPVPRKRNRQSDKD